MYGKVRYKDALKVEYLKIFIIHNTDGTINTQKTLYVLSKCIPEFCENWDKRIPLSTDSIYRYLQKHNYEQAMVRIPDNKAYTEITFQRDKNQINARTRLLKKEI